MASIFFKDTAKALVFTSGLAFDGFALDDSGLSEQEIDELIEEIEKFCKKGLSILEKKYGMIPITSATDIVDKIIYEQPLIIQL
ncbi:hypothetical protein [Flavobacterium sp. NRK1]|uniref:hypothetical protein n=1 Tax=Flavobacterium sp. NRK1 TaxID=2954929 RepID=UPI002093FD4C|nr:hypothetical protein [Flavobacterium sp. NRK1]MCO6149072.1 hypothetical protein [Flavobacterium sp. NRK1]